jgi:hypothetical protein
MRQHRVDQQENGTKLCHAKPGDVVSVYDAMMRLDTEPFLVSVEGVSVKKDGADWMLKPILNLQSGRTFLVSLHNGRVLDVHTSNRVKIHKKACFSLSGSISDIKAP